MGQTHKEKEEELQYLVITVGVIGIMEEEDTAELWRFHWVIAWHVARVTGEYNSSLRSTVPHREH